MNFKHKSKLLAAVIFSVYFFLQSFGIALAAESKSPLFPEASDPVLGDRAAIVEWAWSPAYAKRFGIEAQGDGLKDGPLWLIGIKVLRSQHKDSQSYRCRFVGLIDHKAPILTPPGDRYLLHPSWPWVGDLPGPKHKLYVGEALSAQFVFAPAQGAWRRNPINQAQRERPESGFGARYLLFHRYYTPELAYFELDASCAYFRDPETIRNEVRFPTRVDNQEDKNKGITATWASDALTFDIPDRVMRRIYPYTLKANDWTGCLMRRAGDKTVALTKEAIARLNTSCEPVWNK